MTIEVGVLEQAYIDEEASYAVSAGSGGAALSATDAIRHLELTLSMKNNREPSPEKRGTPDVQQTLPRRRTQSFNLSAIMWEPSGTIGTQSNVGTLLDGGFGSKQSNSGGFTSTVSASPSPTTSSFTLASTTGLAVGDLIAVTTSAGREAAVVLTLPGSNAVTCTTLSAAPATSAAVVAGVTYRLASVITKSYSIYKYYNAGNFKEAVSGAVVDQVQATFDGTKEVMLSIQGPAGRYANSVTPSSAPTEAPPQAKPGSHTTVGAPASGMVGTFMVDGTAHPVISVQVTVNNNLQLRNKELGGRYATGIAGRTTRRTVTVRVTTFLENTALWTKAVASGITSSTGVLRCIIGDTNGSMLGFVCPKVEFEIPDIGNEDGPKEITFEGVALASSGNDQITIAEL